MPKLYALWSGSKWNAIYSQMLRFGVVGVVNTAVGLGTIYAAKWIFSLGDLVANVLGYSLGLCCSFALNRSWTFQHKGDGLNTALRFFAAVLLAYLVNLVTVFGLRDLGNVNSYVAQTAGIIPYTVLLYVASRFYVFPRA